MRIFITGVKGQLGRALQTALNEHTVGGGDLPECDITDRACIQAAIKDFQPDVVLHCAAMTDVDGCARQPGLAHRVNGLGTQNVALACQASGADLLAVSTNEVFDGRASQPYTEFEAANPINPYGRSKLAGEWYVQHLLTRFYIVRTSWLYASDGRNFPHRILQLADERGQLRVVDDEIGSPTFVIDLAQAIVQLVASGQYGIYHFGNDGFCSRFDMAREILRLSGRQSVTIEPVALSEFKRDSTPPPFAPLVNVAGAAIGIQLRPWQAALAEFINKPG